MFEHFPTEKLTLIKKDGSRFEDVEGLVQKGKIFIEDSTLPIEEEDQFVRILPNNLAEVFIVEDRGYYPDFHNIKAHYQTSVKRQTSVPKNELKNVTYNLNGSNSRVNIHSNDYSVNTINQINETNVFEELRRITEEHIKDEDKKEQILQMAEEMENEKENPSKFIKGYQKFMQLTKESMDTFGPIISELTKFLG